MVKYSKRRYYRRRKSSLNKVMRNYFKTKLTTTERILLGPGIWTFSEDQGKSLQARTVLRSCSEWTQFSAIFQSMKITGILLETFPNIVGTVDIQNSVVMQGTYVLAYRPALAPANFNALCDTGASIVLSTTTPQRKYVSFNGSVTGWMDTNNIDTDYSGLFNIENSGTTIQNANMVWTFRVTFYITFKNPK